MGVNAAYGYGQIGLEPWLPWQHRAPVDFKWEKTKIFFFSESMRPTAYIFSM